MKKAAAIAVGALSLTLLSVSQAVAQGRGNGNGSGQGNGNAGPAACEKPNPPPNNPHCQQIALTVQSDIDFGRLVLVGDGVGRVVLDLETGSKLVFGGLDDLGGFAVKGQAVISGTPNRVIRIDMPAVVTLSDPAGGEAEMRDIVTDLGSLPVLDTNGQLTFEFSGTLFTDTATALGGTLRGRFPISVEYN